MAHTSTTDTIGSTYELRIYKLDPTSLTSFTTAGNAPIWKDSINRIESPSLFIRNGYYYVSGSETEGWGASKTYYKKAIGGFANLPKSPSGTYYNYADGRDCHVSDGSVKSCDTDWKELSSDPNITSVKPVKSFMTQHNAIVFIPKNDQTEQFIYMGERWSDAIYSPDYMCSYKPIPYNEDMNCQYWSPWPKDHTGTNLTSDGSNSIKTESHYHWAPLSFGADGTIYVNPAMNWWDGLQ